MKNVRDRLRNRLSLDILNRYIKDKVDIEIENRIWGQLHQEVWRIVGNQVWENVSFVIRNIIWKDKELNRKEN